MGVREAHKLQQLGPLLGTPLRPRQLLVQRQELVGGEPVGEAEQLGEVSNRGARLGGAGRRALYLGAAARGSHETAGDLRERRLAGAVRAQQAEQLALRHLEIHAAERDGVAVALLERLAAEGGGHRPQCRKLPGWL